MAADPKATAPEVARRDAATPKPFGFAAARRRRRRRTLVAYLYVAPAMLTFLAFFGLPFLHTAWLSFFDWDGITIGTFTGLENYKAILTDDVIRESFVHAGILVLFFSIIPIAAGLFIASMFRTVATRGGPVFRVLIFLPQVISMVVLAVIWSWIYASDGPFNEFLRSIGLGFLAKPWLGDFTWALPAIGMVGAWALTGLCMVLFVAGIQQIDNTFYDAARVDGAGRFREFTAVTWPALRYEVGVAATLTVVAALSTFDLVFVMTRGGPGTQTQVPGVLMYNRAFVDGRVGAGMRHRGRACGPGVHHHRRHRPAGHQGPRMTTRTERVLAYSFLTLFSVIAMYPVVGAVLLSLNPRETPVSGFSIPWPLHWETFAEAWDIGHFSTYLRSSFIVSTLVVIGSTALSVLSGYAFGTMRFKGDTWLFYLMISGMILPLEAVVIPLYYDFREVGLTNTYAALVLPQIALNVCFGTFWMRAYFRSVPKAMLEAAEIDGAGSLRTLLRVALPPGKPALLTLALLLFMWSWNQFMLPLVMVTDENLRTAPLGLAFFTAQHSTDRVGQAAAALIISAPIVILFLIFQRSFISGMATGSVKG